MGASDTLLEFRRTGGRASNDRHLVVGHDGHATVHRPDGIQELQLSPATLQQLRRDLDAARFAELPEDLRHPPREGEPTPDVVEYAITADGHTVRALGSAPAAGAAALLEALNVLLQRDTWAAG